MRGTGADERTVWWSIARASVGSLATAGFRFHVEGAEQIPDQGGALLVFNHVSVLDALVVGICVFDRGRTVHTLGLSEDFERPVMGWALRHLDQIPVRRGVGDWSALQSLADVVSAGRLGAIAPEGAVGNGTVMQKGQKGAARVALLAGAPVIPVGIWGTQRRWSNAGIRIGLPVRPALAAVVGAPLAPAGDAKHRPDVQALTDLIMAELGRLVGQAKRLAPGAP